MDEIFNIKTVAQLNYMIGSIETKHPLITVIDFSKVESFDSSAFSKFTTELYCVVLKGLRKGSLKYGRQNYDFQEGTLVFMAPNQVISVEEDEQEVARQKEEVDMSWGIFFHPDLIKGTSLNQKMKEYSFFSYGSNEALHLSQKEKLMLTETVHKIEIELSENIDIHSKDLIVSNIELLLNYCVRYYGRQFITRTNTSKGVLARFEVVLTAYFDSDEIQNKGLPTVQYCADKLHLSSNYLGDLLKKETGKNALEHIHYHLIEEAKSKLLSTSKTIGEIAFELGFSYPQYFSKIFKQKTGFTPGEYRSVN
jgi:AraC-like DNA-binding protein